MSKKRLSHAIYVESGPPAASSVAQIARSEGLREVNLEVGDVADQEALEARIASVFKIPYRFRGLDAAISLMADLDWLPSQAGYCLLVSGLDDCPEPVAADTAGILPDVIDRWRSGTVPFVAVLACASSRSVVLRAVRDSNQFLADAGNREWNASEIGPVPIIVDGVPEPMPEASDEPPATG